TQSLGERASGLSKLAGIDPIGSAQLHDHVCPPAVAGARVRHIRSFCEVSGGWRGDREMSGQTGADSRRMSSAVLVAQISTPCSVHRTISVPVPAVSDVDRRSTCVTV